MANIKPWLKVHNFEEVITDKQYELVINTHKIEIDLENEKIKYPNLINIGRKTTINFSAEENFVVLDIIIGLLIKFLLRKVISLDIILNLGMLMLLLQIIKGILF